MAVNRIKGARAAERVTVQFTTENAAFDDEPATEIARTLRDVGRRIRSGPPDLAGGNVLDSEGNTIGHFTIDRLIAR